MTPDPNAGDEPAAKTRDRRLRPLSRQNRRRLLRALQAAAEAGDVSASAALVGLFSLAAERDLEVADLLRRLRAPEWSDA
jgi:hypothetical protein